MLNWEPIFEVRCLMLGYKTEHQASNIKHRKKSMSVIGGVGVFDGTSDVH